MSNALINRSNDLKKLRDAGYEIEVRGAFLLVQGVPYVNRLREVGLGILVSELTLAGDVTTNPTTHVIHFVGGQPCDITGTEISSIRHSEGDQHLVEGVVVNRSFSNKPDGGFRDYYEKVTNYVDIISAPAEILDPTLSARSYKIIESEEGESVFRYLDTNSSRAEIDLIADKLKPEKIGIVGLGGTGSYVLDMVAKSSVAEIHLFDRDDFLQHNAFRAPGAASIEDLHRKHKKVDYFHEIYSKMRSGIFAHPLFLDSRSVPLLDGLTFIFICMDRGTAKAEIIEYLEKHQIAFVDVGMGVEQIDDRLSASLRVTTSTPKKRDHIRANRLISFSDAAEDDYDRNIQVTELNALNAALAVVKWKKLSGYYIDLANEYDTTYSLDDNALINEDHEA